MKTRVFVTIAALVVVFLVGGAMAYAQRTETAEIGFPFVAAGKEMAAGKYIIEASLAYKPVLLKGPTGNVARLQVITLLGRHDRDAGPELVFDKVDGKLVLSEIWLSGGDGFLVFGTKGPHEHAVVGGSNPRK